VIADIRDTESFEETIEIFLPQGIIHTAAVKAVAESIENPDKYFDINSDATSRILEVAKSKFVKNFIFSSSAAVYGSPAKSSQVKFFNVVGTASLALLDNSIDNLLPIVINKLKSGEQPVVFGSDYPTQDGTCIRDFVDVRDVAEAHFMAALNLNSLPLAFNVGTGRGRSVNEVIDLARRAIGRTDIDSKNEGRRLGDVAELTADVTLIQSVLGFRAKYCLEESIASMI
jgi:UDP-glucose 4-epimerase